MLWARRLMQRILVWWAGQDFSLVFSIRECTWGEGEEEEREGEERNEDITK